ncbi:MAG TPA: hypothetical protein VH720_07440 [Candidatus Limnocylindrales bacterium]|jgi:hypothetical protein
MSPTAVPTRITIDFRDDVLPSRAWILGVGEPSARVELLAFQAPWTAPGANDSSPLGSVGAGAACTCPEFCERDHANE